MRRLAILSVVLAALVGAPAAPAADFTTRDHMIPMDDGVGIAATVYTPAGQGPFPAVMLFHGIGQNRQALAPVATTLAAAGYVALASDFRGHGQSGGLFTAVGPREIADIAAIRSRWLPTLAPVDSDRVGAWGISLGGGAVLRAAADGVRFSAIEVVQTWTDLADALAPQAFPKSGAIFQFLSSVPRDRQSPELTEAANAVARRDIAAVRTFSRQRSTRHVLRQVRFPPTLFFQGRRDFAFGLEQGLSAWTQLSAPKALYIGPFGHAPSRFPGPDATVVMQRAVQWFNSYVRGLPAPPDMPPVELAPDPFNRPTRGSSTPPATRTLRYTLTGRRTIGADGKVVRRISIGRRLQETFGAPVARIQASSTTGWSHLVAVLVARTPDGREIVVSEGGVPTELSRRARAVTIRLISQVTTIPARSRLELTLAATSTAQNPANLLYLVPVSDRARITIGKVTLTLPVLRTPVSK
jgi:pimeloyl-ACP methyl ester carboxylesterase